MPAVPNSGVSVDNPAPATVRARAGFDVSGAGPNASTWVGILVIISVMTLYGIRASFRRAS